MPGLSLTSDGRRELSPRPTLTLIHPWFRKRRRRPIRLGLVAGRAAGRSGGGPGEEDGHPHALAGRGVPRKSALAFWRSDWTIIAPSLPGLGQLTPSGRPLPSSATMTRQPVSSTRLCRVMVPPLAAESVLERIGQQLVDHQAGRHGDVDDTGQVSTLRSRRMPSTACACMTDEAIWLR